MNSKDWRQSSALLLNEFAVWLKKRKAPETAVSSEKKPLQKKQDTRSAA